MLFSWNPESMLRIYPKEITQEMVKEVCTNMFTLAQTVVSNLNV